MSAETGDLRLEARLRTSGELHLALLHRGERGLVVAAIAAAVALHVAAAVLPLRGAGDRGRAPAPRAAARAPVEAHVIVPGPPELEVPRAAPIAREAPPPPVVPAERPAPAAPAPAALLPDAFEPVAESDPEMSPDDLPSDASILLGSPEPPPAGPSPAQAGSGTVPELIQESRVLPVFPQGARQLGVTGNALLDVTVLPDGTVGEISVLRCTPPDVGFCQSAMRAVKRWRYRPAMQGGKPVQASVPVIVEFVP